MEIDKRYQFFFVGGSCGSFVQTIFYYYLHALSLHPIQVILRVNPTTGDCHQNFREIGRHYHHIKELDPTKKLILIDFDDDDKPTIAKMVFHKRTWKLICKDPKNLTKVANGQLSHLDPTDFNLLRKTITENPFYVIWPEWRDIVALLTPELTIKFKDILFGELNQQIADYFKVLPMPEVDEFIEKYRIINKKYIDKST